LRLSYTKNKPRKKLVLFLFLAFIKLFHPYLLHHIQSQKGSPMIQSQTTVPARPLVLRIIAGLGAAVMLLTGVALDAPQAAASTQAAQYETSVEAQAVPRSIQRQIRKARRDAQRRIRKALRNAEKAQRRANRELRRRHSSNVSSVSGSTTVSNSISTNDSSASINQGNSTGSNQENNVITLASLEVSEVTTAEIVAEVGTELAAYAVEPPPVVEVAAVVSAEALPRNVEKEQKKALKEAEKAVKNAKKDNEKAIKDAQKDVAKQLKQIEKATKKAQKDAKKAIKDAQKDAEKELKKAERTSSRSR